MPGLADRLASARNQYQEAATMATYHATPYAPDHAGFYFESWEDYQKKAEDLEEAGGPEEFEIQFIDGDQQQAQLFEALGINQANLREWFEDWDEGEIDEQDAAAAYYLAANNGMKPEHIDRDEIDDAGIFHGTAQEYAEELADDLLGEQTNPMLARYFDYDKFARDLQMGDITEFRFCGQDWVARNN